MGRTLRARLVAYSAGGERIGLLPQPTSWKALVEFDATGSLTVDYDGRAIGAEHALRRLELGTEIAVEVSDGYSPWTEPPSMRYLVIQDSGDSTDDTGSISLTCVSYGWLLNKVLNLDTSKLLTDTDNKGKRPFYSANAGTIIETMLGENEQRGGAAAVIERSFDTAKDSSGAKWATVNTLYYSPGVSVLTMLDSMVEGGMADWDTQGRTLRMWNADSTARSRDRSDSVIIQLARGVQDAPYEETIEDIASYVLVSGDNGLTFTQDNPAAPTPWGKWESYYSQGGVSDEGTAKAFMQSQLSLAARMRGSYTHDLLVADATSLPFVDYCVGDWITAPTVNHGEKVRVRQLVLSLDNTDGDAVLTCSVTLNDSLYDYFVRQSKKIEGITGGASLAGSEGGSPASEKDHRVPKAPENLVVGTDAYIDANGVARGVATASWDAVTQATDDTAIEIKSYEVIWRENKAGADWNYAGRTDDTTLAWSDLPCGMVIAVRARAIPTYSDSMGEWSNSTIAVVANDVTPPSVPSQPTLASELGVVTIHWDGLNESNGGMEADFDHVIVGRGTGAANIAEISAAQAGACDYIDSQVAAGSEYWYALRSIDHAGNKSDWSQAASITVASAVTPDDLDKINADLDQAQSDIAQANEDLDATKSEIGDLQNQADAIQKTADGKNSIYHSYLDPTKLDNPVTPTAGDMWYKLESELPDARITMVYVWDGGAWNPYTFVASDIIAANTVTSNHIAANSISTSELVAGAVTSNKIAANSITSAKIVASAITADKLATNSVTADKIAARAITADKIAAGAITSYEIAAGAITAAKLAADAITGKTITGGTITGATITATKGTIGGLTIASSSVYNSVFSLQSNGINFDYNGYSVGKVGTNSYVGDSSIRGLVFDLDPDGAYMTWAAKTSSSSTTYATKLTYARKAFSSLTVGLNAQADFNLHGYKATNFWIDPNSGGANGGITGKMNFVQVLSMNSNGSVSRWGPSAYLEFKAGLLVNASWYS